MKLQNHYMIYCFYWSKLLLHSFYFNTKQYEVIISHDYEVYKTHLKRNSKTKQEEKVSHI